MPSLLPELFAPPNERAQLKAKSRDLASLDLTPRQICDLELLMNGGFFPLTGFLGKKDYDGVLDEMRLSSGLLWPIPITLDISDALGAEIEIGAEIVLRNTKGTPLAVLSVTDKWRPDKAREAEAVFGTSSRTHPSVRYLAEQAGEIYIAGPVTGLSAPIHYDFRARRHTPNELRNIFSDLGWQRVVAFQTHNPLHRADHALGLRALEKTKANLLLHPTVGLTKPGDIDYFTRVRCYEAVLPSFPAETTMLSLLDLAMRMAGPREALWHGLIRKNYGCSHIIIGHDHAGPGQNSEGKPFYPPYAAQQLFATHQEEMGIEMVDFKAMVYAKERAEYIIANKAPKSVDTLKISSTELRRYLDEGLDIPDWFSFPEVIRVLRRRYPPRAKQGFTVFFTGLSGSGKSMIANALRTKLMEIEERPITLLDGDIVRKNLSSELGFSRTDRDLNIRRIAYVASEITKNRGIAICAPIAPYSKARTDARNMIETEGLFIEVHVATSLQECERRDRKGLYAKARAGLIEAFTGISDPYEVPENPDLRLDTEDVDVDSCTQAVLLKLKSLGLIAL